MNDFQSLFQAHPETFCSYFPFAYNLKLLFQIQLHITYAPPNVKSLNYMFQCCLLVHG